MKVVAFLQNQWVRDPERLRAMIERDGEAFRRKFLKYALFAGCLTGRRIKAAFGELCDQIVWEEVTRQIGAYAGSAFEPDLEHCRAVLRFEAPNIVITFGRVAADALHQIKDCGEFYLLELPHPADRRGNTIARLHVGAGILHDLLGRRT